MENKQPFAEDTQLSHALPADKQYDRPQDMPVQLPPRLKPTPRLRRRSPWHYLLLLLSGLACYALLIILAALVWGYITYALQGDVAEATLLPLTIFLGAIFLSSCLITAISRGGTIFPALALALLTNGLSLLVADMPQPPLNGLLMRLTLSLLVAIAAFTVSKLLIVNARRRAALEQKRVA